MSAVVFNLLDEPWIPCLLPSGAARELSLREALLRAPEIAEVLSPSPPVTVSLHRLLLAILHRVYGPRDGETWGRLWAAGAWPREALERYLDRWAPRFELFAGPQPFGQCPGLPRRLFRPLTRLAPDLASGTQPTLFDHSLEAQPRGVPAAQAACWLLAYQNYCLGGRCGDGERLGVVHAGPLAHGAAFLLLGRNLFETLMLNLLPYAPAAGLPWPGQEDDAPAWEQAVPGGAEAGPPRGWLDYLTWPSRRLALGTPRRVGGQWLVTEAAVAPGRALPAGSRAVDPMLAYRGGPGGGSALALPAPSEWRPVVGQLLAGRGAYRRPAVWEWLSAQLAWGGLPADYGCRLAVLGIRAHRAHIGAWGAYRLELPARFLTDNDLQADLERCLATAGDASRAVVASGGTGADFWAGLREAWDRLVSDLPDTAGGRDARLQWWARECERAAWQAVTRTGRGQLTRPRSWPDVVRTRRQFRAELYGGALQAYREVGDAAADVPRPAFC